MSAEKTLHLQGVFDRLSERASGAPWRVHGNGFLQIPLTNDQRVHVWDKDYFNPLPDNNATIHDHVWDFDSTVLAGSLTHIQWKFLQDKSQRHLAIHSVGAADQPGMGKRLACVELKSVEVYIIHAGESYSFKAGEFHSTPENNRCVTIMQKRETSLTQALARPRVVCPINADPTDAFGFEQNSQESLRLILWTALSRYSTPQIEELWRALSVNN